MSLIFDGVQVQNIIYEGSDLNHVFFDGVRVWEKELLKTVLYSILIPATL